MSVRYVVETRGRYFGQAVTVELERGTVESVEHAHRCAARHPIVTGLTTPAARILPAGSDANGIRLLPGNSVLYSGERGTVESVDGDRVTVEFTRLTRTRRSAAPYLETITRTVDAGELTAGSFTTPVERVSGNGRA